jgi:gentisate 1,2-dioxygenase
VIWLDAIDTPFVRNMNAIFYEQYGSMKQPLVNAPCSTAAGPGLDGVAWMPKEAWRWPTNGGLPMTN